MANRVSKERQVVAIGGRTRWTRRALLGLVCALVIGVYAWSASSGMLELLGSDARNSYYNVLVQGFRDGHLNMKREAPPELAQHHLEDRWLEFHGVDDLSYYKGKLYLYFGVTPAVVLFWPYAALTGHYLLHKDAVVIFFSAGFLAEAWIAVGDVAATLQGKRHWGGGGGDAGSWPGQFRAGGIGAVRCL